MTGDGAMLGLLLRQAEEQGADLTTLRALVEEAAQVGATRALTRLGLDDARAGADMAELRELLGAWRDAKRSARNAVIAWALRLALALLLMGLAVKLGLGGLVTR